MMALRVSLLVLLLVCGLTAGVPLIYKSVTHFHWRWTSAHTGAHSDASIWALDITEAGYYSLGDVATPSLSKPTIPALAVKEMEPGALAEPAGLSRIWDSKGSGGSNQVVIYRLDAKPGYACLGNVVGMSYTQAPDISKYRCVKGDYVKPGSLSLVWTDEGSPAEDVGIWRVVRGRSLFNHESGSFLTRKGYGKPVHQPFMLSSDFAKNHMEIRADDANVEVKLFKTEDLTMIWNDKGSKATYEASCWRPKAPPGAVNLADIVFDDYDQPNYGFYAEAVSEDALRPPIGYTLRAKADAGTQGAFWEPACSIGYVALGHVCTAGFSKPALDIVRCVKGDLVRDGKWVSTWKDTGSFYSKDMQLFTAVPAHGVQQGVLAMGAMGSWASMNSPPYVFQAHYTSVVDRPVKSYKLTNVKYDLDELEIVQQEPTELDRIIVINRSSSEQTPILTIEASWTESNNWQHDSGVETSISIEAEAGIPLIGKSTVTVGVTGHYSYTTGGEESKEKKQSVSAPVRVKPRHQGSAILVGTHTRADIPYTADMTTYYQDGTVSVAKGSKGIYTGVSVSDTNVLYDDNVPITDSYINEITSDPSVDVDNSQSSTNLVVFNNKQIL